MAHLLKTGNPKAASRIEGDDRRPIPEVGALVRYHPRPGEVRRGRTMVPAIVTARDEANRLLELVAIHEANDVITQERVPEHVDGDRGWSRLPIEAAIAPAASGLAEALAALQATVMGDYDMPADASVLGILASLDERVAALETAAKLAQPAAAKPARRRRGTTPA